MFPYASIKMELERKDLIKYMQMELICTIGSADAPCTIPVLITLFREDTGKDLAQLSKHLNCTSIKAMLESDEFDNIIEPCYTDLAKGAGNNNPQKVWCYKLKARNDFAHILTSIEQYQLSKEEERRKKIEMFTKNPINRELVLEGKERILRCLHKLEAENGPVPLLKLQQQYNIQWGVEMNKKELKQWFPTGKVQQIFEEFMFDEIQILNEEGHPGLLHFKMKKNFAEAIKGIEEIRKKYEEAKQIEKEMKLKKKKNGNGNIIQQVVQPKKEQKRLPPILVVIEPKKPIPPQLPKPKPVPILQQKNGIKTNKFSTDDPQLFVQIKNAEIGTSQNADELFCEISELSDQRHLEEAKGNKTKYTKMAEGAEATDSEAEFDEDDKNDGNVSHLNAGTMEENGLNNTSTSSNSSNNNNNDGQSKEDDQMTFEKAQQIQLAHKRDFFALAKKKQEKSRRNHEQFVRQETKRKEGKLRKIEWTGRRAKEAKERKERQAKLLAKLEAKWVAEGMPTKERFNKTEKNQAIMAALLSQMIWANDRIGISEAEQMLRLFFFNLIVDIDVKEFVKERIKIAKFLSGPEEEYIAIKNVRAILDATAGYKRKKTFQ